MHIYIIMYIVIYNDNEPHGVWDYTHYFQRTPSTLLSGLIKVKFDFFIENKGQNDRYIARVQALKPILNDFFWVRVLLY